MSGQHEGPPIGSAAREATAPPYVGKRRVPWSLGTLVLIDLARAFWDEPPDDPPRCGSCGHVEADECGCTCCTWDHDERPADV